MVVKLRKLGIRFGSDYFDLRGTEDIEKVKTIAIKVCELNNLLKTGLRIVLEVGGNSFSLANIDNPETAIVNLIDKAIEFSNAIDALAPPPKVHDEEEEEDETDDDEDEEEDWDDEDEDDDDL